MDNTTIENLIPSIKDLIQLLIEYNDTKSKEIRYKIEYFLLNLNINEKDEKEVEQNLWILFNNILDKEILNSLLKKSTKVSKYFLRVARRRFMFGAITAAAGILLFPSTAFGQIIERLTNSACYQSKRLRKRKFILYHVTDGYGDEGSRQALRANESVGIHYLMNRNGDIEHIIPDDFVAHHAGTSLWDDYESLNNWSVGIECVDNKTGNLTDIQYEKLKLLFKKLKNSYGFRNEDILPHGAVRTCIYRGTRIRGGRICGLKLSRRKLNIGKIPEDRAVKFGQLGFNPTIAGYINVINAEIGVTKVNEVQREIALNDLSIIQGDVTPFSIAGDDYDHHNTVYLFPNKEVLRGDQISNWNNIHSGTKVFLNCSKEDFTRFKLLKKVIYYYLYEQTGTIFSLIGGSYNKSFVAYILDNGEVVFGDAYNSKLEQERLRIVPNIIPKIYDISEYSPWSVLKNNCKTDKVVYIFPAKIVDNKIVEPAKVLPGNHTEINFNALPDGTRFILRDV